MAEASDELCAELKELLECPLCLEKSQDPKTLPCHHWLCTTCLKKLIQTSAHNNRFLCPNCRTSITVPHGGLSKFPSAFFVNRLNEAIGKHGGARPKDHLQCPMHAKEFEMFCDTCQQLVCVKCCVQEHKGHSKLHVEEIVMDHQQIVEDVREQLAKKAKESEGFGEALCKTKADYHSRALAAKQAIQDHGENIIKAVRCSMEQMQRDVDNGLVRTDSLSSSMEGKNNDRLSQFTRATSELSSVIDEGRPARIVHFSTTQIQCYKDRMMEGDDSCKIPNVKIGLQLPDMETFSQETLFGPFLCNTVDELGEPLEVHNESQSHPELHCGQWLTSIDERELPVEDGSDQQAQKLVDAELGEDGDESDPETHQNVLEILGVPETASENLEATISRIAGLADMELKDGDIFTCFRADYRIRDKKPIVVIFQKTTVKQQFITNSRKLKIKANDLDDMFEEEQVYVNEYLQTRTRRLLHEARKKRKILKYKHVWVKNGQIFMRKTDKSKVFHITCLEDLESL